MSKVITINATLKKLAAAFTEWDRRYRANPEQFLSEAEHLLKRTPKSYGEACAPYFTSILAEQQTGKKLRKGAAVEIEVRAQPKLTQPSFAASDQIVHDQVRGLMWTAATLTEKCVNHATATKVAADCRIGNYEDWRLPTMSELLTLVDYERRAPAIDTKLFPDTKNDWYWSSSLYAGDPFNAWYVGFGGGGAGYGSRGYSGGLVRAVRSVGASSPGQ